VRVSVTAVQKGINLQALQRLLGHDYLATTEIYLNLSPEHVIRVPGQDGIWLCDTGHLNQSLAPESFADLGERGPLWIGQTQSRRQVSPQDAVFRSQVLVLEEQFLIDQASHVRQSFPSPNHSGTSHRAAD
jgi:hypothetical protein